MKTMMNRLSGAALLFVLMLGSAWAGTNTGTMTFTGALTATSCDVDSPLIELEATPVSLLANSGLFAGRKAFKVTLSNCIGSYASVGLRFVYDSNRINSSTGCLKNTAPLGEAAKFVEVCLLDSNSNKLNLYTNANAPIVVSGTMTITYFAEYTATGTATEGKVDAVSTFNLFYN